MITKDQLDSIERFADKLWAKVGLDIEFTRHFLDRLNDSRNKKDITPAEIQRLFKQSYRRHGKKIGALGKDSQAVIKDMETDINMPFVIQLDRNGDLDLVAKTVMRKKDFKTSNQKFTVEGMVSFKEYLTETKISPTFITHIETMKPIDFLTLVKELESEYKGVLKLKDISITEKIDGSSLTIGQDSKGKTFINTKMSQRYFNPGDFSSFASSKGYDNSISVNFDNILKEVQKDKKLQSVLSKYNDGNGIVITGEVLYVPLATETKNNKLQFIFMDYDKKNLGEEWTFVPFDLKDFDGNPIENKDEIFNALYKISTKQRKYTDANLKIDSDIDITLSLDKVRKNILSKYDNIDAALVSRKRIDKPLKDKLKQEIAEYQKELSNQILSYVRAGKFGDDFEGIVLKTKSGNTLKATSARFKDRRAKLKDIKFKKK